MLTIWKAILFYTVEPLISDLAGLGEVGTQKIWISEEQENAF